MLDVNNNNNTLNTKSVQPQTNHWFDRFNVNIMLKFRYFTNTYIHYNNYYFIFSNVFFSLGLHGPAVDPDILFKRDLTQQKEANNQNDSISRSGETDEKRVYSRTNLFLFVLSFEKQFLVRIPTWNNEVSNH